jgi:hypothetical protein
MNKAGVGYSRLRLFLWLIIIGKRVDEINRPNIVAEYQ